MIPQANSAAAEQPCEKSAVLPPFLTPRPFAADLSRFRTAKLIWLDLAGHEPATFCIHIGVQKVRGGDLG
jgi:hypothetical protein